MGKFTRKEKLTTDVVAIMEVSQSTLGVRTRAKTLALQKLQSSKTIHSREKNHELSFLQLRSRRLKKPPLPQSTYYGQENPNPSVSQSQIKAKYEEETEAYSGFATEEPSCGENNIDFDGKERSTMESTPCSFIRDSNDSSTPGLSSRPSSRILHNNSIQRQEIEEFFARHALEQQRSFSEKYNFDIVKEKPIQGRYEWVKVQP